MVAGAAFVVAWSLLQPASVATFEWTSDRPLGLLSFLPLSPLVHSIFGFLMMDLTFYYWHRLNHRSRFLWRFHNVHHIDPDLDLSTAVRFHFGEIALSTAFRVTQISLIGVSIGTFLAYEVVFQAGTLFHHSNIRLPIRVERIVSKVLVTPRMHGIHHSTVRDELDSDFSTIFSWWDRMHGTLRLDVPQDQITIGVPAYLEPGDNTLRNCLWLPFSRQRDYWRFPDGTVPVRERKTLSLTRSHMSE
jgi:sterol desaturase/sphingolipid hydroxylase (fatty acid hydroxylase superfamily)